MAPTATQSVVFSHATLVSPIVAGVDTTLQVTPPSFETMAPRPPTATQSEVLGHVTAVMVSAAIGSVSEEKSAPPFVERSMRAPPDWVPPTATHVVDAGAQATPVNMPPAATGVTVLGGATVYDTVAAPTTSALDVPSPATNERFGLASP